MRLRYISVSYQFGGATSNLERHYRELRDSMLHPGNHYSYLQPGAAWRPPMDIHETPDAILVKVELAGIREDSIEITLYENALVVVGQRDDDHDHDETVCFHEAQVRYGPFRADVALPMKVLADGSEASYSDGFLRIRLPKAVPGQMSSREPHTALDEAGMPGTSSARNKMNARPAAEATHPAPVALQALSQVQTTTFVLPRGE